jgi:hypothetical protein
MELTRCQPAASRRRGPSRNRTLVSSRDHARQALAYVYFEEEPGRRLGTGPFAKADLTRSRGGTKSLRRLRWLLSRRFCGRCKNDRLHRDKIVDLASVYSPGFNYE